MKDGDFARLLGEIYPPINEEYSRVAPKDGKPTILTEGQEKELKDLVEKAFFPRSGSEIHLYRSRLLEIMEQIAASACVVCPAELNIELMYLDQENDPLFLAKEKCVKELELFKKRFLVYTSYARKVLMERPHEDMEFHKTLSQHRIQGEEGAARNLRHLLRSLSLTSMR